MTALQISPLSVLPQIRALGRHRGRNPLPLFWTASGAELLFTGSELWFQLECDYTEIEPWVSIELNGAWIARQALTPGRNRVCAFRGMTPGTPKHVRLLNDVQPMQQDPTHFLQLNAVEYAGGEFLPLPEPRCRLEFVGDSITSGEGTLGARQEEDWIGAFFSAENHYARLTSDALGAEYRLVSQSGWGIVCGWDNDPHHTLPPYYEQVCGVVPEGGLGGDHAAYDFASWKPDAVLCALGANDLGAMGNPARVDPETGESFRQSREDTAPLLEAMTAFLDKLRRCNPDAKIYWLLFGQREPLNELAQTAVQRHCAHTGDARCGWIELAPMAPTGARNHPGLDLHQAQAKALAEKLRALL